MSECFECGRPAQHNHHVVPESLGGTKTIPLCEECHSKVHDADLTLSKLQKEAVRKTILLYKQQGKKWGGGGWNRTNKDKCEEVFGLSKRGLKPKEIAKNLNLSLPTVYRIINGSLHTTEKHTHY